MKWKYGEGMEAADRIGIRQAVDGRVKRELGVDAVRGLAQIDGEILAAPGAHPPDGGGPDGRSHGRQRKGRTEAYRAGKQRIMPGEGDGSPRVGRAHSRPREQTGEVEREVFLRGGILAIVS
jgi:hypothetical protein